MIILMAIVAVFVALCAWEVARTWLNEEWEEKVTHEHRLPDISHLM